MHMRYAIYRKTVHRSSGHTWLGRYCSCPLDQVHLWEALRYTELNPVCACLATEAHAWRWSSAAAHCGAEVGERDIRFGDVAERLDCDCMAAVPGGGRDRVQSDGDSSVHPHRAACYLVIFWEFIFAETQQEPLQDPSAFVWRCRWTDLSPATSCSYRWLAASDRIACKPRRGCYRRSRSRDSSSR
jgi:hypothetical protein